MTIERKIYDAQTAKEVLDNPSYQWVWESIETELKDHLCRPSRSAEDLLETNRLLQLLNRLKATFDQRLETGKLAILERDHKRNLAERIREVWQ